MNKKYLIALVLMLTTSIVSLAQTTRIAVIPFTGGEKGEGEMVARLIGGELVKIGGSGYSIVPRTAAMNKVLEEHSFQRSGLTDADTIAEIGRGANAQYVVTGHIQELGGKNLIIVSMTEVATFRQTAGAYYTYSDLSEIRAYLPTISETLLYITDRANSNTRAPTLAILPFDIDSNNLISGTDAEVLAQILSCEIANTCQYTVVVRTSTINNVMEEHNIQRSGLSDQNSIQMVGQAINADYVLTGYVSDFGIEKLMGAEVINVETFVQTSGDVVEYKEMSDGIYVMKQLSYKITEKINPVKYNELLSSLEKYERQRGLTRESRSAITSIKSFIRNHDINTLGSDGNTALMLSAGWGYTEIAKSLIEAGADVNATSSPETGSITALMQAANNGNIEIAQALIEAGADVNVRSGNYTALNLARSRGHSKIVQILVNAGAVE